MDMLQQRTALFYELVLTTPPCCCCLQTHHETGLMGTHHEHNMVNSSTSQTGEVISERPVAVGVAEVSCTCVMTCILLGWHRRQLNAGKTLYTVQISISVGLMHACVACIGC